MVKSVLVMTIHYITFSYQQSCHYLLNLIFFSSKYILRSAEVIQDEINMRVSE